MNLIAKLNEQLLKLHNVITDRNDTIEDIVKEQINKLEKCEKCGNPLDPLDGVCDHCWIENGKKLAPTTFRLANELIRTHCGSCWKEKTKCECEPIKDQLDAFMSFDQNEDMIEDSKNI